jgi:D-glycero-D-manno-heptose 1,7-bisphosphate phosphatase
MAHFQRVGIFLDADGVLWPERGSGGILDGLPDATSRLNEFTNALGQRDLYTIHVVTNQTFAARGEISHREFKSKVNKIFNSLAIKNLINTFEVCYHHPHAKTIILRRKNCKCRKPSPGMILKTIKKYDLNPERCVIVGDRITDISAGQSAGIRKAILINNSKAFEVNVSTKANTDLESLLEFVLCGDLLEASEVISEFLNND